MTISTKSRSAVLREQLGHPVIDCDSHLVEYLPPIEDYIRDMGGGRFGATFWNALKRYPIRYPAAFWGTLTKNTFDRATMSLPRLLHERMDELGMDFTILFGSAFGILVHRIDAVVAEEDLQPTSLTGSPADFLDTELHRLTARAINTYRADLCRDYADRMTPVAELVMYRPAEAIEDLEHAIADLGLKVVHVAPVRRPVAEAEHLYPKVFRLDNLCLESDYDYDPFWQRCLDLGAVVMHHGASMGQPNRASERNFLYNASNHFAEAGETFARALFFGGVTKRFPGLKVGFMEGGVLWGCRLYSFLAEAWEKRGRHGIENLDPRLLDRDLFHRLHAEYSDAVMQRRLHQVLSVGTGIEAEDIADRSVLDDFHAADINSLEDLRDRFVVPFAFGCEADDPGIPVALRRDLWPLGERLNTLLGSDMGHWDVSELTGAVPHAYEHVERGRMDERDLQAVLHHMPMEFLLGSNPRFFDDTVLRSAAASFLKDRSGP